MSKAFAPGESEDDGERDFAPAAVLPPGAPNYITPAGAKALESEHARLSAERAKLGESVDAKSRRKIIDRRLEFLTARLNAAQIIDPAQQPKDCVRFGAAVTLRDAAGKIQTWHIVGVDETDLDKGRISWISPLAKALMDKRPGDTALGEQKLTIIGID